eukprot:324845-Chlamydomonas_euryale.AAC.1
MPTLRGSRACACARAAAAATARGCGGGCAPPLRPAASASRAGGSTPAPCAAPAAVPPRPCAAACLAPWLATARCARVPPPTHIRMAGEVATGSCATTYAHTHGGRGRNWLVCHHLCTHTHTRMACEVAHCAGTDKCHNTAS